MILRRLARPMIAAVYISSGIDTLRNPEPRVTTAKPFIDKAAGAMPDSVPTDAATLVKANAGIHIGAGALLAVGKFPRLSATALAASMVPTTLAGHAFWEHEDESWRGTHRTQFFKNLSMIGGLLIAAADTGGKPSLGWRARRAARKATKRGKDTAESARGALPK